MGRLTVKVPDVGEGVAEVELVSWAVAPGQTVERNQVIAEVMTDKATVEVPSPVDGVVDTLTGDAGDRMLVGETLFVLRVDGEGDTAVDAVTAEEPDAGPPTAVQPASPPTAPPIPTTPIASAPVVAPPVAADPAVPEATPAPIRGWSPAAPRPEGQRPRATPSVRRRAREAGVDLAP